MVWAEFTIALLLFFASHALPTRPMMRAALTRAVGELGFLIVYSLLSLVMLSWLIMAADRAPYVALWRFENWQPWVPNIVMPACCALLGLGIGATNPLSFGGARVERFDAERPGIAGIARHPILWASTLWALSHLAPNGDLAHVILFGLFAAFSAFGMVAIDDRRRQQFGEKQWLRLARRTSAWPFQAIIQGRWRGEGLAHRLLPRFLASLLLYATLLFLHPYLIGAAALPV